VLLLDSGFGIVVSERAATSPQWLFDTDLFQNVVQIPYKLTKVSRHSSRNNQHYALNCSTPLFNILASTCFDSSLPSSGVVYHIMYTCITHIYIHTHTWSNVCCRRQTDKRLTRINGLSAGKRRSIGHVCESVPHFSHI
jgi:hypothetical protein